MRRFLKGLQTFMVLTGIAIVIGVVFTALFFLQTYRWGSCP